MPGELSKRIIDAAKPAAKPYEIRDDRVRGLMLRVQPSGLKAWVVVKGRGHRMDLYWAQIYRRLGSPTPNFKRVSNKGGAAHLSHLVRGAFNADEANLIKAHEFHARKLRKLWSDFLKTRAGAKTLMATSRLDLDDTGLELEPSSRSTA